MATTLKTHQSTDGELAKALLASVAKEVICEYADGSETMCPGVSWRAAMNGLTVPLRAIADELETRPEARRIAAVLNDPAASFWLKLALVTALSCDPVDVANDCEHLSDLLGERADCMLSQAIEKLGGSPDHESL
jgi:hypothetical protein